MLRTHITFAFRNFQRNLGYSLLNLGGLTLGLMVCMGIWLYVADELSYDQFHEKGERIALFQQFEGMASGGGGWKGLLERELSQAEQVTRLLPVKALLTVNNQSFYEPNFYFADSNVFDVFSFTLTEGNPDEALNRPYSIVLSEKAAKKYFGQQSPLGKTIRYENRQDLTVTGVMKDLPGNSHMEVEFLTPHSKAGELIGYNFDGYWDGMHYTYLLLSPGNSASALQGRTKALAEASGDPNAGVWKLSFIPLHDIYLRQALGGKVRSQEAIGRIRTFSLIAVLVLLLACFNYINLSTALAAKRAKEVGLKKSLGVGRWQLGLQFLTEAFVFTSIAFLLAALLMGVLLRGFNEVSAKVLTIESLASWENILAASVLLILITLLAGLYPAWVLSGFQPADTLKRVFKSGKGAAYFRKGLVITQFTVSVAMIVATWVMGSQLHYMQRKSLGYDREQVLVARFEGKIPEEKKTLFRQKIQSMRFVKAASFSSHLPGSVIGENKLVPDFLPPGTDLGIQFMFADESHLEALGIELAEGRGFTKGNALGTTEFYINEAAARRFQWKEGAGRKLAYYTYQYTPEGGYREIPAEGEVVGVLRDYHTQSLRTAIEPLLIVRYNEPLGNLAIKIQEEHVEEAIKTLSGTWADIFPGVPFEYHFLDDTYNANYQTEVRSGRVVALFAAFAILISCLGVFGLSAFAAEQRTKEIGIRKVMGASALSIVALLSKDLTGLIVAASLIACPLAWWAMNQWLADFAYRIDIPWWVFALAGAAALLLAFATISFQSIRAAIANPVKSLRSE